MGWLEHTSNNDAVCTASLANCSPVKQRRLRLGQEALLRGRPSPGGNGTHGLVVRVKGLMVRSIIRSSHKSVGLACRKQASQPAHCPDCPRSLHNH